MIVFCQRALHSFGDIFSGANLFEARLWEETRSCHWKLIGWSLSIPDLNPIKRIQVDWSSKQEVRRQSGFPSTSHLSHQGSSASIQLTTEKWQCQSMLHSACDLHVCTWYHYVAWGGEGIQSSLESVDVGGYYFVAFLSMLKNLSVSPLFPIHNNKLSGD